MNHRGDQSTAQLLMLVSAVVVVAALYLGQAVLMPLALAVLLSFLLTPIAARLERLGLWRVPSVLAVTALAFTVLGGVGWLVADQLADLIQSLPLYRTNIRNRIEALWGYGEGYLEWVLNFVEQFQEDFAPRPDPFEAPDPEPTADPVPVTIVQPAPSPLEIARFAGPLLGPLATAAMTIVFTLFILVQRDQLRDRIIRLAGLGRIDVTTKALDDAGRRISRYLLAQVIINVSYGVPIGIGLWIIGLPNALLWGVLAMLVRFVPFIGPWLGSLLPIAMSLAVFDDWTRPAAVISLFVTLELFSNNVMEPWLYGSSTGISMLAVVLAVVFWTWLWGAIGLVLATPLTVCLMVLGKYVDRLAFLNILLSDEPVLDPRSRFYQRLLAQDHEDALELADTFFTEHSLVEVYDQILVPALHMAERDRHRGRLDKAQQEFAYSAVREIIRSLGQLKVDAELHRLHTNPEERDWRTTLERARSLTIACVPARDEADELAAEMFAQVLTARGLTAQTLTVERLAGERLERVAELHAPIVCISALPPLAVMHARYLHKRLAQRSPDTAQVIGLWNFTGDMERVRDRIQCGARDCIVLTFADALQQVRQHLANVMGRP